MTSWRRNHETYVLLAPALLIVTIITIVPLLDAIRLSFTDAEISALGTSPSFVGIENYAYALSDPDFRDALGRTLYFTLCSVALEAILGVAVALFLNLPFYGRGLLRLLIILPWALPTIVNATTWRLIFHPDYGAFNALLVQVGLLDHYRSWLGDPDTAMNMIIVADAWKNYPLVAYVVLAALQAIPQDWIDAARVEGAGAWTRFRRIILPAIMGPLLVVVVLRSIEAFRIFDLIYVMTRGGPADTTKTASFFVYQEYFAYLRSGSGAAYALIVALISALLIAAYYRAMRGEVSGGTS